jgi:type I restriction enzyme, S subunit
VALVRDETEFSIKNVALFRPNPVDVDPVYFYYLVLSPSFRGVFLNVRSGSAQPFISLEAFRQHKFSFNPDSRQQRLIGQTLSAYDDLIENNRRRMELLEEAARQLYREWFVRLRFPGREHTRIINGVPEGWRKGRVADLGQIITGKTPSTNDESNYGDDIQFVKTPDMHRQMIVVQTEQSLSEKRGSLTIKQVYT